nr:dnaJ homolog subfamily C member 30 [Danio rerio]|eukprot:XP_005172774.1 dnaJ homolog subfamily C member 30 [Danio rerio]
MAAVRLRFGRGAYTLSNRPLLDKPVSNAAYIAALIKSPQLWEFDRIEAHKILCETRPAGVETPRGSKETNSFNALLDSNISKWTDCRKLKSKASQIHAFSRKSSCLGKLISSHTGARSHLRRSIYKKTPYGRPNDYLWHFMSSSRAYSGTQYNSRPEEPLHKSKSAYYDILEVSQSATHAQIKTAYYKQSFIYHPDKNAGSEDATHRFSQINEAYSVLGNKELRRKYDRGILSQADLRGSSRGAAGRESPASGQQSRARHSSTVGFSQQKIFDFDTFIKAHYGEQLQKEKQRRQRMQEMLEKDSKRSEDMKKDVMAEVILGVIVILDE